MPTSRRRFLQFSAAAAAFPPKLPAAFHADLLAAPVTAVIVEAGSAPCVRFGQHCRMKGIGIHEIRDDVTPLWHQVLDQQWRESTGAIAGMTRWPALFCLGVLAQQHRLSVVHFAIHDADERAAGSHEIVDPAVNGRVTDIVAAGSAWPEAVADRLLRMPAPTTPSITGVSHMPRARDDDSTTLHSWLIRPPARKG